MPSTRTEIARRALALFEAADMDRGIELLCPEAEWDVSEMPDGAVYRGHAEIRAYWEHLHSDVWERMAMHTERIIEGNDTLVALVRFQRGSLPRCRRLQGRSRPG